MADAHTRRGPNAHQDANVHGMAQPTVKPAGLEVWAGERSTFDPSLHLGEAQELAHAKGPGAKKQYGPARDKQGPQGTGRSGIPDVPDRPQYWLPTEDQQEQSEVRCVHIGASLDSGWQGRDLPFEPGSRHNRMLRAEKSDEREVDDCRREWVPDRHSMVYRGQRPEGENEAGLGEEHDEAHPKCPHDCKAAPRIKKPGGRTIAHGVSMDDHAGQRLQHTEVPEGSLPRSLPNEERQG